MKYDFTSVYDRRGKDALAVDRNPYKNASTQEGYTKIPMWVADMNFATAPSIVEHVAKRLEHPLFGYYDYTEEYFNSIINWQKTRNGVEGLTREVIGFENGVIGCVVSALQAFTVPGEPILLHAPTYTGFTGSVTNNGRKIVLSHLQKDAQGVWRMDYEDMDRKIKENKIHFAIFCSPHNPTGRVWEKEEIEQAMEVYRRNDCVVISDEIWSDVILDNNKHIPTQSVSEDARNRTIAIYAPSKTFNLAGLIGSYHIIYNPFLRHRVEKQSGLCHYNNMNVLSMHALIGAYTDEGQEWLDELRQVLTHNVNYACDFIRENFKGVEVSKPQGTYMLYLDCTKWLEEHGGTMDELLHAGVKVGVIWQDGRDFNKPNSIRLNVALPETLLVEAFNRMKKYVF